MNNFSNKIRKNFEFIHFIDVIANEMCNFSSMMKISAIMVEVNLSTYVRPYLMINDQIKHEKT